jgi:argininosuccinate synthase
MKEHYGRPIVTVTINTGGIDAEAAKDLERRSVALGAIEHVLVEARSVFFDRVLKYLIFGNVRRGHLYPLCVGAERGIQATLLAELAKERGSQTVAHGCTAAGNDQGALRGGPHHRPGPEVLAPVRDLGFIRTEQHNYLVQHGFPVPAKGSAYSVNRGLWGVTVGGRETLDSKESIPEDAWVLSPHAFDKPQPAARHTISFTRGVPTALDGKNLDPVALIEALEAVAGPYGIGRGIHVGDTVLGTKGRVAFEAPAADILLTAHRELEKLVLSGPQQRIREGGHPVRRLSA